MVMVKIDFGKQRIKKYILNGSYNAQYFYRNIFFYYNEHDEKQ